MSVSDLINQIGPTTVGILTVLFALFATYWTNKKTEERYRESREEQRDKEKMLRAPLLVMSNYRFEKRKYEFVEENSPPQGHFTFDRRAFKYLIGSGKKKTEAVTPYYSLFLDLTKTGYLKLMRHVGFGVATLKNIGYDMQSIGITKIEVFKGSELIFSLSPTEHNRIFLDLAKTNRMDVKMSFVTELNRLGNCELFDVKKMYSETFVNSKAISTGGNLLNTYFREMADLWTDIHFHIITTNVHNEQYKQTTHFFIRNHVYYSESKLAEPMKDDSKGDA